MELVILIEAAIFTANGIVLGTSNVLLDTQLIETKAGNMQLRMKPHNYTNSIKGVELEKVDHISTVEVQTSEVIISDPWADVSAGAVYDKAIEQLEARNADWAGKITKAIYTPPAE